MDFETTTCISYDNVQLLTEIAAKLDIPLHSFIVRLLIFGVKNEKAICKAFKSIAYRKRNKDNPWKRVHLYVQYREYEYLLDIKKLWKMSIARAIEYCVEHVLDEFTESLQLYIESEKRGNTDNYLEYVFNRSYLFEHDREEGVHSVRLYWGLPKKYWQKRP
ncbi:MAG: hypothetical protein ACUVRK_00520 [Spirochaetota bacterium]